MYIQFKHENQTLIETCYQLNNEADKSRPEFHSAAIAIQSVWRGHSIRQNIRYLAKCAIKVQSLYRGYLQRKRFHQLVDATVKSMRSNFYNRQATKIQAVFRGYLSRKNVHNFYARKRYLEMVKMQNSIVKEHLGQYKAAEVEAQRQKREIKEREAIIYEARRTHYLLSTRQVSGVYDSRTLNGQRRQPMEEMLRAVKPLTRIERKQPLPAIGANNQEATTLNKQMALRFEKANQIKQPQGPFKRERDHILEQRFRPLNPSLRVSEPYDTAIEEARQQLKFDDMMKRIKAESPFLPVVRARVEPYSKLLHTTSAYGHIDYGNKHFRRHEETPDTQQTRFESVVSPIPFFDKYLQDRTREISKKNNKRLVSADFG